MSDPEILIDKRNRFPALGILSCAVPALLLLAFALAGGFYSDEGFNLLAAQLIKAGKRPYLDFFYQNVPLYAYVGAFWMKIFGDSWRSMHVLSAILTGASIFLMGSFVFMRISDGKWRLPAVICTATLFTLHLIVIRFATIGQAYGMCLFLIVLSFRLQVKGRNHEGSLANFSAGFSSAAATASSMLAAPVAPILLVWMLLYYPRAGLRKKVVFFIIGAIIPFLPLFWLAIHGPQQVIFDVFRYHLIYRRLGVWRYQNIPWWDLQILTRWLGSPQSVLLAFLALTGFLFLRKQKELERAELLLVVWLVAGFIVYLATAHPTFPQYFVLIIPFLSMLASVGVYALGSRALNSLRPVWLILGLIALYGFVPARWAYRQIKEVDYNWHVIEQIAREVNRVTPSDGLVYADEEIHFAAKRFPPAGMENSFGSELHLPLSDEEALHIVPNEEIAGWLADGRFATVVPFDPQIEGTNLGRMYDLYKKSKFYSIWIRRKNATRPE